MVFLLIHEGMKNIETLPVIKLKVIKLFKSREMLPIAFLISEKAL